ncbi:SEC-C metal-binding domain-containing protein [Garciella nitratireducens]|uniref:SEC-C metal-binding domain-containing protein n=1 Tax=Garciella nitratireducens TaxID=218205 RepID=UPI000DEACDB0|nr:SEC-C metal-binding domain-containing protein [Garciella nitratireducens]RBP40629.1 SEC-C motif-containing protein [Garciella nitratireducens]
MSLYQKWRKIIEESSKNQQEQLSFWEDFCIQETKIYKDILSKVQKNLKGSVEELSKKYGMSEVYFIGFLDGINESLVEPLDIESLEKNSMVEIEIDFEKLLYNMYAVPAEWLYSLAEWENIFDGEKRKEIEKQQKRDKILVKGPKIGRNAPCPCGSGKKYKKCCGQ